VEPRQEFGIDVGFGVIIVLLIAFGLLQEAKETVHGESNTDFETADPLDDHEMRTSANTHEMNAKMSAHFQVKV
jgi:hypothetical protein